ncbi:MAG TPA: hypothetical protein VGL18_08715 [Actinomycetota bacterium]|jgi:hypothetical protein
MDVYKGPPEEDFSNQIHDFDPGIAPSGLFWTTALPSGSVTGSAGTGNARMHVTDLAVRDYHDIPNALQQGPFVDATVSFDMRWTGGGGHVKVRDHTNDFGGRYVEGTATIEWSGVNAKGEFFQSDPANTSVSHFAEVGKERNGIFFQ